MKWPVARAPYASKPEESRGRLHPEPEHATRSPFQRDRDRIIHSTAFRRLQAQDAGLRLSRGRSLPHAADPLARGGADRAHASAARCGLDEDLAEAVALAHDLGHTPFGHAGEEALDAAMKPFGGFVHNAQTLRILTKLEQRYAEFDGLNLTWETLEGTVKHNGPLGARHAAAPTDRRILPRPRSRARRPTPAAEAQVAALADDIAYNNHDIDDGLRAGLFARRRPRGPAAGRRRCSPRSRRTIPASTSARLIHEAIRRLIDRMVTRPARRDARAPRRRARPSRSTTSARSAGRSRPSPSAMRDNDRALKRFLYERMYRHYRVNRMQSQGAPRRARAVRAVLRRAATACRRAWRARAERGRSAAARARIVADYIAGMTDRFALDEHRRLFDTLRGRHR